MVVTKRLDTPVLFADNFHYFALFDVIKHTVLVTKSKRLLIDYQKMTGKEPWTVKFEKARPLIRLRQRYL